MKSICVRCGNEKNFLIAFIDKAFVVNETVPCRDCINSMTLEDVISDLCDNIGNIHIVCTNENYMECAELLDQNGFYDEDWNKKQTIVESCERIKIYGNNIGVCFYRVKKNEKKLWWMYTRNRFWWGYDYSVYNFAERKFERYLGVKL